MCKYTKVQIHKHYTYKVTVSSEGDKQERITLEEISHPSEPMLSCSSCAQWRRHTVMEQLFPSRSSGTLVLGKLHYFRYIISVGPFHLSGAFQVEGHPPQHR